MKKRLFIGIPLSADLNTTITIWKSRQAASPLIRWIKPHNLHITLVPPWETETHECDIQTFKQIPLHVKSFILAFAKITYGPHADHPRLIWLLGETPKSLPILTDKLTKRMNQPIQSRPFKLHTTLARCKENSTYQYPQLNDVSVDWRMRTTSVVLYESILHPDGAEYKQLVMRTLNEPDKKV